MKRQYKLLIWSFSQIEGPASNLGDRAILSATIDQIKRVVQNVDITVLSSNPEHTKRQYGVNAVYIKNFKQILKAVRDTDLVVLGGGEFIQDRTSLPYLILNLSVGFIGLLLKKPITFYAIGVASKDELSSFGRFLSRQILKRAKLITVRDIDSINALVQIGVHNPATFLTADPALALPAISNERENEIVMHEKIKTDQLTICVSARRVVNSSFGILPSGFQLKLGLKATERLSENKKLTDIIARTLDTCVQNYQSNIIFIPMYTGKSFSYRDDDFEREIMEKMVHKEKICLVEKAYSPEEMQCIIKHADIMVSMTLHALILATSKGVPSIAIAYSSKAKRFMNSINQNDKVIEVREINSKNMIEKIDNCLSERSSTSKKLMAEINTLQNKTLFNAKLLACVLLLYCKR